MIRSYDPTQSKTLLINKLWIESESAQDRIKAPYLNQVMHCSAENTNEILLTGAISVVKIKV